MPCKPIKMKDGTVVLANMRPGQKLTEADKQTLAEWVAFCRERRDKEQRKRNTNQIGGTNEMVKQ